MPYSTLLMYKDGPLTLYDIAFTEKSSYSA